MISWQHQLAQKVAANAAQALGHKLGRWTVSEWLGDDKPEHSIARCPCTAWAQIFIQTGNPTLSGTAIEQQHKETA